MFILPPNTIVIQKINQTYAKAKCEPSIAKELSEHFCFVVPNANFHPKVKARIWDGKIRMYNLLTQAIYYGLMDKVQQFCQARGYTFIDPDNVCIPEYNNQQYPIVDSKHLTIEPRNYQLQTYYRAVTQNRGIFVCPTSSGKSLIIALISLYYNRLYENEKKTLIIVPTTTLVQQLSADIQSYYNKPISVYKIVGGVDKYDLDGSIVISTWQSIYKLPSLWYEQFHTIIADEVHLFKAKCLSDILENAIDVPHKLGFTGSLDDIPTNELTLNGLFGPTHHVILTKQLIDDGVVSKIKIKVVGLQYLSHDKKLAKQIRDSNKKSSNYQHMIKYIESNNDRTKYIVNLALSQTKNTMILFEHKEHGKQIYNLLNSLVDLDRKVYYIDGDIDGSDRNDVRIAVEDRKNDIIVASYKTFSTGINIKNLHNLIFGSPFKGLVRLIQSLGRTLRLHKDKDCAIVYDIGDIFTYDKYKYGQQHMMIRIQQYAAQQFEYNVYNVILQK